MVDIDGHFSHQSLDGYGSFIGLWGYTYWYVMVDLLFDVIYPLIIVIIILLLSLFIYGGFNMF